MVITRTILAIAAALLLTGCGDLLSLHPLYVKTQALFDPSIEGLWESEDSVIAIARQDDYYTMELKNKSNLSREASEFEVHLADIGGVRFADLLPIDQIGHMFVRIRVKDGELAYAFLDSDWLRKQVPHENTEIDHGRTQAILVQKTPDVRKIVAKYAHEPRAYDKEYFFHRVK